ncbi:MAG: metallophosphatase domain-containing protein, partial [Flammeovirgaceae bacterium]|nr:metallophosphatase domain-containing protein [Flammeovirgaceae bacterium]
GDILLHAGDVSKQGKKEEILDFLDWFAKQLFEYKIFIAGNHDFFFEKTTKEELNELLPNEVIYLQEEGVEIDGIKFWGSPITPFFNNWAFNRKANEIKAHWDKIPTDTDVLITHGPAKDMLDRTFFFKSVGCPELKKAVERIRPKLHLFGHIHEAYGQKEHNGTRFVNASLTNILYKLCNQPVTILL